MHSVRRVRGMRRNHCSFVTTQMVDCNEGLDLPADSRFYTCAESEKLYHHCCIDSAGIRAHVQIPFPSGIIKTAALWCRREKDTREDRTKNRREKSQPEENPAGEMRPQKRQYEGRRSRFSHLFRKGKSCKRNS